MRLHGIARNNQILKTLNYEVYRILKSIKINDNNNEVFNKVIKAYKLYKNPKRLYNNLNFNHPLKELFWLIKRNLNLI